MEPLSSDHCDPLESPGPSLTSLKVISLNFCSLRSSGKRAALKAIILVDEHKPHIIMGCETHLGETYASSEVFPPGHSIIRKDRCNGGGGVFLAISQDISFLELSITTNGEMIWAKITPIHGEPIAIG